MNRLSPKASDDSRISETAHDFNERTPLLGNGTASNKRNRNLQIRFETPDEQTPLNENEATSSEHGPLDESCATSSGQTPPSGAKRQPVQATPLPRYEDLVIDDELYAIGGAVGGSEIDDAICRSAEINTICGSTAEIDDFMCGSTAKIDDVMRGSIAAVSDAIRVSTAVIDASKCADETISETQVDFDIIVKSLFLSWVHFPPSRSSETYEFEFFTPKALQALTLTWRHIKTQKDVLPEPKVVVQGLTETIVHYFYLRHLKLPKEVLVLLKRTMTTRITELVEEGWKKVLDGIEKEDQERARKKRERRRKFREKMRRDREVADILRFYAPFARINTDPPPNFRRFCLLLCGFCSLFIFQIPIHTLLLGWPISIGVMGGLYMKQCPMSHLMPYVMMALGVVGTVALLLRLTFVIYQRCNKRNIRSMWPWIVLKFIEFTFLDCLIVQLVYFFSDTPNYMPGTVKYCNETFYNFVQWTNYLSIALVSIWIFVYCIKGYLWLRRRTNDYGYR